MKAGNDVGARFLVFAANTPHEGDLCSRTLFRMKSFSPIGRPLCAPLSCLNMTIILHFLCILRFQLCVRRSEMHCALYACACYATLINQSLLYHKMFLLIQIIVYYGNILAKIFLAKKAVKSRKLCSNTTTWQVKKIINQNINLKIYDMLGDMS